MQAGSGKRRNPLTDVVVLGLALLALGLDQATKWLARLLLRPHGPFPQEGAFRLTYVTNTGSAFGLFPNQTLLLIAASLVGIGVLLVFYRTHPRQGLWLRVSLGLQLGGALGNLLDRLRQGYVVDFVQLGWWPVFNLADASIVVGLLLMVVALMAQGGSRGRAEPGRAPSPSGEEVAGPPPGEGATGGEG